MSTQAVSELRLRMIEDMKARQLNQHTQRSHIYSCKRFAAYLKRSPETATADEVRELPRPLLKYAWQASLVDQPTLPGLGLQYCCSSCA